MIFQKSRQESVHTRKIT